ncbi:hypothetical protein [Bradyrhizobium japonicum]|uniref:hypothetical protein n=1 Tax=Bradyrhizobium japonicum TaxID=375 RepID=UPI003516EC8A
MRRTTVLVASALIGAFANPGLAAEPTLDRDVNAARTASAAVHSKAANAADTEKICRVHVASVYESLMLRQAVADGADGARVLATLDSLMNIFNDLRVPKCGG